MTDMQRADEQPWVGCGLALGLGLPALLGRQLALGLARKKPPMHPGPLPDRVRIGLTSTANLVGAPEPDLWAMAQRAKKRTDPQQMAGSP